MTALLQLSDTRLESFLKPKAFMREQVLGVIEYYSPVCPISPEDVVEILGLKITSVRPRVTDLHKKYDKIVPVPGADIWNGSSWVHSYRTVAAK